MQRIAILVATALIAAFCGDASAADPQLVHKGGLLDTPVRANRLTTLYDQTGNASGTGVPSQNFEDEFDIYDDMLADDFAVPDGTWWKLNEIYIEGTYFDGTGPARSLNIAFY